MILNFIQSWISKFQFSYFYIVHLLYDISSMDVYVYSTSHSTSTWQSHIISVLQTYLRDDSNIDLGVRTSI